MKKLYEFANEVPELVEGNFDTGYEEAIQALLQALNPQQSGRGPQMPQDEIPYDPNLPQINNNSDEQGESDDKPPHNENPDDININNQQNDNKDNKDSGSENQDIHLNEPNQKSKSSNPQDSQGSQNGEGESDPTDSQGDESGENQEGESEEPEGENPGEESTSSNNNVGQQDSQGSKKSTSPRIGYSGDEEEEAQEREEIRRQIARERAKARGQNPDELSDDELFGETEEEKQARLDDLEKRRAKYGSAMTKLQRQGNVYGHSDLDDENNDVRSKEIERQAQQAAAEKQAKKDALRRALNPIDHKSYGKVKETGNAVDELLKDIDEFKDNCQGVGFVSSQAKYNKKSGSYKGRLLYPGRAKKLMPDKIPVINVYYDRSTSWNKDKYQIGMDAIARLNDLEEEGKIKINVYYFADRVGETLSEIGMNSNGGPDVINHIRETEPDNVFIMTDEDLDYFGDWNTTSRTSIPGTVFLVFRGGISYRLMDYLQGDMATKYYDLGDTDGIVAQRHQMFGPNPFDPHNR